SEQGRWPANVIFDEAAAAMLDEQSGVLKSGELAGYRAKESNNTCMSGKNYEREFTKSTASIGGASRFVKVIKAESNDIELPCVQFAENQFQSGNQPEPFVQNHAQQSLLPDQEGISQNKNTHALNAEKNFSTIQEIEV